MTKVDDRWQPLFQVLVEELRVLRPEWGAELESIAARSSGGPWDVDRLRELFRRLGTRQGGGAGAPFPDGTLCALCFSGGGIRSATFNLGVLQALARLGALPAFDYLSTVSGGGYIGSWLQAWIAAEQRKGRSRTEAIAAVAAALASPATPGTPLPDPLSPDPKPVDQLREFSNYLTPRKGLLSGDSWAVAAIVTRNLLLNWLVILPVLAAGAMVPQLVAFVVGEREALLSGAGTAGTLAWAALLLAFLSSFATHWFRGERRGPAATQDEAERLRQGRSGPTATLATLGLFLAAAVAFFLLALAAGDPLRHLPWTAVSPGEAGLLPRLRALAPWTIGLPVAGALASDLLRAWRRQAAAGPGANQRPRGSAAPTLLDLLALVVAGGFGAVALAWLTDGPWTRLLQHPTAATIVALPALLVVHALARALSAGVLSLAENLRSPTSVGDEADREWWARVTGRTLLMALSWLVGGGLLLLGGLLLQDAWRWTTTSALATGGASALAAAALGKGGDAPGPGSGRVKGLLLSLLPFLAIACTLVVLAHGTSTLAALVATTGDAAADLRALLAVLGGLLLVSAVAGSFVDVNRFSLHRMYRNRLVRAYLGASNERRQPNPLSGFDPEDHALRLADLLPKGQPAKLLPIVNVTLNLVRGQRLGWQDRQAESFSMTPLHCGNFYEGYWRTSAYGSPRGGLSLGSAMAISGAAANPNMGYASRPALAFLLGLLNGRLGAWLANPGPRFGQVVSRPGPRHGTTHLLRELLGLTSRYAPFVNLSDGGHFENLALYEVVLRRCRLVVVSDAGCDPDFTFSDLGNAIRRIRVDFGIPITFEQGVDLLPRGKDGAFPGGPGHCCAVGTIHYDVVDGPAAPPGRIIYLKPTLASSGRASIPRDVRAYAVDSPTFPHESTADQWFSEEQFESYRALGEHLVMTIGGAGATPGHEPPGLAGFIAAAEAHARG